MQCKNVFSKFQRRIDKEGQQIVPLLADLWKRIENSGYISGAGTNLLDLRKKKYSGHWKSMDLQKKKRK